MKQTPLTNMEDRWVHSTKEAFDSLVEMGYEPFEPYYKISESECLKIWNCDETEVAIYTGIIDSTYSKGLKQAYYHNGHFYDHPYEEFTITEEKVPFPELEDIEWVMVEAPEWAQVDKFTGIKRISSGVEFNNKYNLNKESREWLDCTLIPTVKILYENSKDFKVTWKLKEKINRKLHENRTLALAIGRWLLEGGEGIHLGFGFLWAVQGTNKSLFFVTSGPFKNQKECTLPDDYIIPDQVLQWMKEYQEQGIK